MSLLKITGVAVIYAGRLYTLPAPNRHHHVLRSIGGISGPHTEGFVLDDGSFLGRVRSMQLAQVNGQFKRREGEQHYQGPELYSEDLW